MRNIPIGLVRIRKAKPIERSIFVTCLTVLSPPFATLLLSGTTVILFDLCKKKTVAVFKHSISINGMAIATVKSIQGH